MNTVQKSKVVYACASLYLAGVNLSTVFCNNFARLSPSKVALWGFSSDNMVCRGLINIILSNQSLEQSAYDQTHHKQPKCRVKLAFKSLDLSLNIKRCTRWLLWIESWLHFAGKYTYEDIRDMRYVTRYAWSQMDSLLVENCIFNRKYDTGTGKTSLQAIIHRVVLRTLLQYFHDMETARHLGMTKTLASLQQNYCWTGLSVDTRIYKAGC